MEFKEPTYLNTSCNLGVEVGSAMVTVTQPCGTRIHVWSDGGVTFSDYVTDPNEENLMEGHRTLVPPQYNTHEVSDTDLVIDLREAGHVCHPSRCLHVSGFTK